MREIIQNYLFSNWQKIIPDRNKPSSVDFILNCGSLVRNLKATFLVFPSGSAFGGYDKESLPFLIIRVANDECGKTYLNQEWNNLVVLSEKYQMGDSVPQPLHKVEQQGYLLVFESYVKGSPLYKENRPDLFSQTCDWLIDFHHKTRQDISKELFIGKIESQINFINDAIKITPQLKTFFSDMVEESKILINDKMVSVFSHNDFSPRNVMISSDKKVYGMIDWEYAEPIGMPLRDLYHFAAYYYPANNPHELLLNFKRAFYQQTQLSYVVRKNIISYCNVLGIDISLAELFFWLHLICPLEESIKLSMPYYSLWELHLFVLESLVKERDKLKFIV
ncbi:MAG: aminoglycoside phosphotransferase family protein [Planctomycetota bacterium]